MFNLSMAEAEKTQSKKLHCLKIPISKGLISLFFVSRNIHSIYLGQAEQFGFCRLQMYKYMFWKRRKRAFRYALFAPFIRAGNHMEKYWTIDIFNLVLFCLNNLYL